MSDVKWEYHKADTSRSRRFLNHRDDNFLVQVLTEPTRKGVLLDLFLEYTESVVGAVEIGGCLGHSDHEVVELKTFVTGGKLLPKLQPWIWGEQTSGCSED